MAGKIIYKWAILHGYVSHNQRVHYVTMNPYKSQNCPLVPSFPRVPTCSHVAVSVRLALIRKPRTSAAVVNCVSRISSQPQDTMPRRFQSFSACHPSHPIDWSQCKIYVGQERLGNVGKYWEWFQPKKCFLHIGFTVIDTQSQVGWNRCVTYRYIDAVHMPSQSLHVSMMD